MFATILQISFRNLVRQKRRSLLLGIAIAFGAMILIVANSFSRGISDVLFNRIITYVSGHISINFSERGNFFRQIFYDKDRITVAIEKALPEIKSQEESIGVFGRAIGNGKSDNVIIVGFSLNAELTQEEVEQAEQDFAMIEGEFQDLADSIKENPVVLSKSKADYLNVKKDDILKIRFTNVLGQEQAARLTVVGVFKPANVFMSFPIFVENRNLKPLMGYGPHDTAPMYVYLNNPRRDAARLADSLHAELTPKTAIIPARLSNLSDNPLVPIVGFRDDSASMLLIDSLLNPGGDISIREGVFVNTVCAGRYALDVGDTLHFTRRCKHDSLVYPADIVISAITDVPACSSAVVLLNAAHFYRLFYAHWPLDDTLLRSRLQLTGRDSPLASVLAPEWELMERSKSTKETMQRFRDMAKLKSKAVIVDVRSMYETASAILQLEVALNLITVVAVVVLFFIILIGVVNTLRMTIRERTREIGTIRSIGMQRHSVRSLFLAETTMLAFFSSLVGTGLAFVVMALLKLPSFGASDNPMGMLLVNGHLHFAPSVISIAFFVFLICLITACTAWFPARRAANLPPSHALRHIE